MNPGRRRDLAKGLAAALALSSVVLPASLLAQGKDTKAPAVLNQAIRAFGKLRYTGRRTVTVLQDGRPERHEEIVMRDGPRIRIEFPRDGDYAGQVIVENAKERRHFFPATNELRVLPPRRKESLQRLRNLARTGRFETTEGDRIAGYSTREVTVLDKSGNALQRFCIEPKTGLVLRRRVYDATGLEIGGFVYTKIDLNPAPLDASLFRIERKGVRRTTNWDAVQRLAKRDGYQAVGLPESTGFRLDSVRVAKEGPFFLQQYFGPDNRRLLFCQFQGTVDPARLRRLANRLNSLTWKADGLTFVLLGPQDDATLAKLKAAVRTP